MNTKIEKVSPGSIKVSEFNERTRIFDTTEDDSPSLRESIEEVGIVEPPKVREINDGEYAYEVVVGQRRVKSAQGILDEIEVIVGDWSDEEALTMSISENIEGFKQEVPPTNRARALQNLWEMMGGEGKPSPSALSQRIGVPKTTVSQWLEVIGDRWEDSKTTTEPLEDESSVQQTNKETIADKLGERKLKEIRKATDNQEESDEVAERVYEEELTQKQVKELRTYLEDGKSLDRAVEKVQEVNESNQNRWSDFSNQPDTEDVEDPTDVVSDDEEEETQETSSFTQQIQSVETVDVELEGEFEAEFELPEKTYERAESFASDFDFDSVEDFLLVSAIPEYLESDEGTSTLIDTIESKVKKRGY